MEHLAKEEVSSLDVLQPAPRTAEVTRPPRRPTEFDFATYQQRYAGGEGRTSIFRDMILADMQELRERDNGVNVLDIGCGHGFDNDSEVQRQIASQATHYIGVEPDGSVAVSEIFDRVHHCFFEDAEILPGSIHVAFATFVLEHIPEPTLFFDRIDRVLCRGGVFWGFTVEGRHPFAILSRMAGRMGLKEAYLDLLYGKRGETRYEDYDVFYRSNTRHQLEELARSFRQHASVNFRRIGQLDFYVPKPLRFLSRNYERLAALLNWPGTIRVVRVVK